MYLKSFFLTEGRKSFQFPCDIPAGNRILIDQVANVLFIRGVVNLPGLVVEDSYPLYPFCYTDVFERLLDAFPVDGEHTVAGTVFYETDKGIT